jgi:hypothetical protein
MNFLRKLLGRDEPEEQENTQPERYHCIRFMTERGEQIGMLLTQEEFETAVSRWVHTIKTMPIQESDEQEGVM